tara:strand:+ start:231 stop:479 length:249 start_codon:yes stop_codon:yes gene_type:complete
MKDQIKEEYDYTFLDGRRVWTATTDEFEVEVEGTRYKIRRHENDKGAEMYIYVEGSGWEDLYTDSHGSVENYLAELIWTLEI